MNQSPFITLHEYAGGTRVGHQRLNIRVPPMDVRSRRILAVVIMLAAAIASIWWIDRRVQDQMDRLGHHVRIVEPGAMENDQP